MANLFVINNALGDFSLSIYIYFRLKNFGYKFVVKLETNRRIII